MPTPTPPTAPGPIAIEYWPLADLLTRKAKRNPKLHAAALDNSITRFGYCAPVTIDERTGVLCAGHGRVDSLAKLQAAGQSAPERIVVENGVWYVPVVRGVRFLSDAESEAFALADNQLTTAGGWDEGLLATMLTEQRARPAGLQGLGWSAEDVDALLLEVAADNAPAPIDDVAPQTDRTEELQEQWRCALGDVWTIGPHRAICGDCREPATWARLLAGVKANGVFTSPPYAEQRKEQYGGVPTAEYVAWWEAVQANVKANLAGDGSFFVNIKPHCEDGERVLYCFDLVLAMKRQWGWRFVDELCWINPGVPGSWPNRFKDGFEPVYHFAGDKLKFRPANVLHDSSDAFKSSGGMPGRGHGGSWFTESETTRGEGKALPSNVIATGSGDGGHAAAFPVALPDFFIRAYSDTGDVWVDPFCGSGTTILAAHQNGRIGLGIEVLPKYLAVILQRLQDATHLQPVRVASGA